MPRVGRLFVILLGLAAATPAVAQTVGLDLTGRPVAEVRVEGLVEVDPQLVLNQIRLTQGTPYDPQVVSHDIVRITHVGRFASVEAKIDPQPDGAVVVRYVVVEQPLLRDVQVVGNKALSDQKLLSAVVLRRGDPIDSFLIDRGIKEIERLYRGQGYFEVEVGVEQEQIDESRILLYRVREGPKIRLRQIRFEGNQAFTDKQLRSKIQSKRWIPIFNQKGMSREQLTDDAGRLRQFYYDRGYLDARVGRRLDLSPHQKDAIVVFLIEEGLQYTVDRIRVEGSEVFASQQIIETLPLHVGDVFTSEKLRRSQRELIDLYGKLGYLQTRVQIDRLFYEDEPKVELLIRLTEGQPNWVGTVTVRGNQLTQEKVIYRQLRGLEPGRRFDRVGIERSQKRLRESPLFDDAKITILGDDDEDYRDVLVEVKEANTGRLSFGAGISSDAGLVGAIDVTQRNFDIANGPDDFKQLITGKAFRGAGQYLALGLQPGNETSRYSLTFREPYLFDSQYFLDTNFLFFEREREDWDEERLGGTIGVGQRFGDVWSASIRVRGEQVDISAIEPDAPTDVFAVEGESVITSIGLSVSRTTTDSRLFPTKGNRFTLSVSRAGALGGDYDFTKLDTEFRQFWTVDEDFFGRRTVLSLRTELGYIFEDNEAPIFERFYAGGHRTFRGFQFRGVGPRGIRNDTRRTGDDPIGGDWMLLVGLEYNFPIYQEVLRGVVFTDTGTVDRVVDVNNYRVSVGAGLRLKIPFLGQAPFALDFAVPVVKEDGDETQVFSFDLALPF